MRPARILLLAVALVAGMLAAFLVMRGGDAPPATVVTEVVREEARTRILVASTAIGMGQRLTQETVEWTNWPEGAVRREYLTEDAMPDAPAELTGALARFAFFPGEPIREQKLVRADQGYLSAVLSEGMRGVSVPVSAESSAGGYVVPNDRVDVVLSRSTEGGRVSEVVLSNVRVLAIGKRLGEVGTTAGDEETAQGENPQAQIFDGSTIATLELTPGEAQTLINAQSRGQLSLMLRSIEDFDESPLVTAGTTNNSVQLIRYGQSSSVMAGQTTYAASAAQRTRGPDTHQFSDAPEAEGPQTAFAPLSRGDGVPQNQPLPQIEVQ